MDHSAGGTSVVPWFSKEGVSDNPRATSALTSPSPRSHLAYAASCLDSGIHHYCTQDLLYSSSTVCKLLSAHNVDNYISTTDLLPIR